MSTLSTVQLCGNGLHEMTPENTQVTQRPDRSPIRRCVACRRAAGLRWVRRHRSSRIPVRDLVEQAIARGELLEDIATRLGVSVERCYRIADAMDEAVG